MDDAESKLFVVSSSAHSQKHWALIWAHQWVRALLWLNCELIPAYQQEDKQQSPSPHPPSSLSVAISSLNANSSHTYTKTLCVNLCSTVGDYFIVIQLWIDPGISTWRQTTESPIPLLISSVESSWITHLSKFESDSACRRNLFVMWVGPPARTCAHETIYTLRSRISMASLYVPLCSSHSQVDNALMISTVHGNRRVSIFGLLIINPFRPNKFPCGVGTNGQILPGNGMMTPVGPSHDGYHWVSKLLHTTLVQVVHCIKTRSSLLPI